MISSSEMVLWFKITDLNDKKWTIPKKRAVTSTNRYTCAREGRALPSGGKQAGASWPSRRGSNTLRWRPDWMLPGPSCEIEGKGRNETKERVKHASVGAWGPSEGSEADAAQRGGFPRGRWGLAGPRSQRPKWCAKPSISLSSLPPHPPNPDCLREDNLSLAENAKTVHFSQTLKNSN